MAARDDGEFELILGNKQLLSVLFIVIVLLGVFFAMGFLAGRSTGGSALTGGKKPEGSPPLIVESAAKGPETAPETVAAANPTPTPAAEVKSEPKPAATKLPETAAPEAKAAPKAPPVTSSGFVESPPAGTYLQVAATRRAEAETMLRLLNKSALAGFVTPAPGKPELNRVIVGPLSGPDAIAATRESLKKLGIERPIPVKY